MKKIILLSGPSTAGKTTFLRALGHAMPGLCIIPQTSCRQPRPDDEPRFLKILPEEVFNETSFWIRYKQFGLSRNDYNHFIGSDAMVAVSISGIRELAQAKSRTDLEAEVFAVLLRMSMDPEKEKEAVRNGISEQFNDASLRLEQNERQLADFFLNDQFIDENIDLLMTREETLSVWVHTFVAKFKLEHLVENQIDASCTQALQENSARRPLLPKP